MREQRWFGAVTPTPHPSHSCLLVTQSRNIPPMMLKADAPEQGCKEDIPFPNPPAPYHAVTASTSPQPQLLHPSLPGTRMGRTSPDQADVESHGPGCTTPCWRTAGVESGTTGRTPSILHGDVHCLFHNTPQLPSQTQLEGFLLAGSLQPPPGLVAGKQSPISQGIPSSPPWHRAGRFQLQLQGTGSPLLPQSGGHLSIGGMHL